MPIPPPSTNFPWSPDANYPAGSDPWSGNPTKVTPVDDKFTPGVGLPATYLNKLLADRDATIQALITAANNGAIYLRGSGHLEPANSGHIWTNTSGTFVVAEQLGLKDTVTGLTPFSAGVVAGDFLEVDFSATFFAYSNEVNQYYAWPIKLVYSETATDFVTGTWFEIEGSASVSLRFIAGTAGSTVPDVVCVTWSWRLAPLGTTGHVRFAIAADRGGSDQQLTAGNCGGRWRWLRSQ